MALDELKFFRKIENMTEYVRDGIISGKLSIDEVAKFARIHARQGTVGEQVATVLKSGLEETKNTVKLDETTGQPGWIVTNPDGEEYIVEDSAFRRKYEIDPEDPSQFKPVGGPVLSSKLPENVEFVASWGETMRIEAGGSLIIQKPDDIYGVEKEAFEHTYASTGRDKTETLKDALAMFGISKEDILAARQEQEEKPSTEGPVVENDEQEI